jgi:hypothetical protein
MKKLFYLKYFILYFFSPLIIFLLIQNFNVLDTLNISFLFIEVFYLKKLIDKIFFLLFKFLNFIK